MGSGVVKSEIYMPGSASCSKAKVECMYSQAADRNLVGNST